MKLRNLLALLFLLACTSASPAPAYDAAAYAYQLGILDRSWYEIDQETRQVICWDYFADPGGSFEYLKGRMDGQLLRQVFDDFFSGVCRKIPIEPLELSG